MSALPDYGGVVYLAREQVIIILYAVALFACIPTWVACIYLFFQSHWRKVMFSEWKLTTSSMRKKLPHLVTIGTIVGIAVYIYINWASSHLYYIGDTAQTDISRKAENAMESLVLMFPTSLLLNLMVFIYDIEKSSVNNVVLVLSFIESVTILIPIPMTLIDGIKFEQVLIPRSIALFMDLVLMLYVNWQLTPVLRVTQDPNLKLFRLRWNLCFYTVVFNNVFMKGPLLVGSIAEFRDTAGAGSSSVKGKNV